MYNYYFIAIIGASIGASIGAIILFINRIGYFYDKYFLDIMEFFLL